MSDLEQKDQENVKTFESGPSSFRAALMSAAPIATIAASIFGHSELGASVAIATGVAATIGGMASRFGERRQVTAHTTFAQHPSTLFGSTKKIIIKPEDTEKDQSLR
jgi:hypothetical protein